MASAHDDHSGDHDDVHGDAHVHDVDDVHARDEECDDDEPQLAHGSHVVVQSDDTVDHDDRKVNCQLFEDDFDCTDDDIYLVDPSGTVCFYE